MADFTHVDDKGRAQMVDVGDKPVSRRRALARARLVMEPDTLERIIHGEVPKGDVLAVARTAAELRKMMPFLDPVTVKPGEGPISEKAEEKEEVEA